MNLSSMQWAWLCALALRPRPLPATIEGQRSFEKLKRLGLAHEFGGRADITTLGRERVQPRLPSWRRGLREV
jgi:hypothetical protein